MGVRDRLAHAWNAFTNPEEETPDPFGPGGYSYYGGRPDRPRASTSNERSILASIFTRLAIDVSSVDIRHVRTDEEGRYEEDIDSGLNNCLQVEANLDQAATAFKLDYAFSLFDKGVVAIVPTDTTINPKVTGSYDIQTMRVGYITAWWAEDVRCNLWNQKKQIRQEITLPKRTVAIVENPFYAVMNEPNSTLKRLIRKLNLLDVVDDALSSGKLDLILQLPYTIKSEARREQAQQRLAEIEFQLKGSKHGIAYTDRTEKITQLNRPVENNLLKQIEVLFDQLYRELGLTPEIMNGTADEATMLNYNTRTVDPIVRALQEAMKRTFITKTGRSQRQSILYFRDPFKLVPVSQMAEIADKLTRNEVVSSNEVRQGIGLKPSKDPKADELRNSNMPETPPAPTESAPPPVPPISEGDSQNGSS